VKILLLIFRSNLRLLVSLDYRFFVNTKWGIFDKKIKMKNPVFFNFRILFSTLIILAIISSCRPKDEASRWLKGNVHTHTFWSDGDDFPESVAKWYKENDYDFLVFTDHNILLETPAQGPVRGNQRLIDGELWQRLSKDHPAVEKYIGYFGEEWVDIRPEEEDNVLIRLRPLDEFRDMFEEQGEYMLIMGNEITDQQAVHLVAIHQDEVIPTVGGSPGERADMMREIVRRVDEYRERSGRNTWPALAHPNFRWAITAEKMLEVDDLRFFEVYNGHPAVNNQGDDFRASTDRIWDIILSMRLSSGNGELLYGLATDDTHNYHASGATPGRGWVKVRSNELETGSILDAIDRGDFYSTTGVTLNDIGFDGREITVDIKPEEGVTYTTEYIGTLSGFDTSSTPALDGEGNEIANTTRTYSEEIGQVLAVSNDLSSSYTFTGNELYVRVRITSSADQVDRITGEVIGKQVAWVQPVIFQ
jgi:hypothetical protein